MTINQFLKNYTYNYKSLKLINVGTDKVKEFSIPYSLTDYLKSKKVKAFNQSFLDKSLIIYY